MVSWLPYPNGTCWSSILWPSYRCSIMWWQSHFSTAVLLSGRWAPGPVYNRNLCTTYSYAPDNSTALPSTLGALDRGEDDTRLSASFTIVEEKKNWRHRHCFTRKQSSGLHPLPIPADQSRSHFDASSETSWGRDKAKNTQDTREFPRGHSSVFWNVLFS